MPDRPLDVITLGRSSVDLYCEQIGTRLEDADTFKKSVGGCPANIAIGASRLGLRTGIITRVGGDQFGGYIVEQFQREGVSTDGVAVDEQRLTGLAILSMRDQTRFPLLFYRENCADMAMDISEIDPDFVRSARAVLVTGTHLSRPNVEAVSHEAVRLAKEAGGSVIIDIDYRPTLWGLADIGDGETRFVSSEDVTARVQAMLVHCDLVVGTEEEFHIAGGETDTLACLRTIRALTNATLVLKRGAEGCVIFDGDIPEAIADGITGSAFAVDVMNVLGAGDAFMSGLLRGYLKGEDWQTCASWANACGAFAVSRLLCSAEIPTWPELQQYLARGDKPYELRKDQALSHVHWATTRRPMPETIMALAIDHRAQLETICDGAGAPRSRIADFKRLAVTAAARVSDGRPGFGMLLDDTYAAQSIPVAEEHGLWIARPVEQPGSRPLEFEGGGSLGARLREWPIGHTVKALCFYHPDDDSDLKARQERELSRLADACRSLGREMLIEIICGRLGAIGDDTVSRVLARLYALGIAPDWWKLEPQKTVAACANIANVIGANDAHCRGILVLGLEASDEQLAADFQVAASCEQVKGFAIGRTIFADAAREWLSGSISDDAAIDDMASRYSALVAAWEQVRR